MKYCVAFHGGPTPAAQFDLKSYTSLEAWVRAVRAEQITKFARDPGPVLVRRLSNADYDVALIGAMPERNNIENYTPRLMKVLGNPPVVIPTHWDRFNVPYSYSQEPAVRRLQPFIDEVKAVSPRTRVIVAEYFKPIVLE